MKIVLIVLILMNSVFALSEINNKYCNDYPQILIDSIIMQKKTQDSLLYKYYHQRISNDSIWLTKAMEKYGYDIWGLNNMDIKYISDSIFLSNQIQNMQVVNVPYFNDSINQRKLYNMKHLHCLSYEMNWNLFIDKQIINAKILDTLMVVYNRIDTLNDWIFDIPNLQYFVWRDNSIIHINNQNNTPIKLKEIVFCEQYIYELPKFLFRMNQLNYLVLRLGDGANYSGIDSIISTNENLIGLSINNSNLDIVPNVVFNLKHLKDLIFVNGNLSALPSTIGNMKSLRRLVLSKNKLQSMPEEIKELKETLKELEIRDNPINTEELEKIKKWLPKTKLFFE